MRHPNVARTDQPRLRPFTVGDAMILIIALATGLAMARPFIRSLAFRIRSVPSGYFWAPGTAFKLGLTLDTILLCFLFFLLPAFVILRLKRPRTPLRSLICQPGFAACAAPCAVFLASLPFALVAYSGLAGRVIADGSRVVLVAAAPLAWVSLIATRRWCPERSWIDRLGRILGALWMVSAPVIFF